MKFRGIVPAAMLGVIGFAVPAVADEEPKRGGTLNYMIPADAPPSFDGHREATYATVHSAAPFYSVLIRANPENPCSKRLPRQGKAASPLRSSPRPMGRVFHWKNRTGRIARASKGISKCQLPEPIVSLWRWERKMPKKSALKRAEYKPSPILNPKRPKKSLAILGVFVSSW